MSDKVVIKSQIKQIKCLNIFLESILFGTIGNQASPATPVYWTYLFQSFLGLYLHCHIWDQIVDCCWREKYFCRFIMMIGKYMIPLFSEVAHDITEGDWWICCKADFKIHQCHNFKIFRPSSVYQGNFLKVTQTCNYKFPRIVFFYYRLGAAPQILVNSAGITRDNLMLKITEEDWNKVH